MKRSIALKVLAEKIALNRGHHGDDILPEDEEQAAEYVATIENAMRDFRWHSERD